MVKFFENLNFSEEKIENRCGVLFWGGSTFHHALKDSKFEKQPNRRWTAQKCGTQIKKRNRICQTYKPSSGGQGEIFAKLNPGKNIPNAYKADPQICVKHAKYASNICRKYAFFPGTVHFFLGHVQVIHWDNDFKQFWAL